MSISINTFIISRIISVILGIGVLPLYYSLLFFTLNTSFGRLIEPFMSSDTKFSGAIPLIVAPLITVGVFWLLVYLVFDLRLQSIHSFRDSLYFIVPAVVCFVYIAYSVNSMRIGF